MRGNRVFYFKAEMNRKRQIFPLKIVVGLFLVFLYPLLMGCPITQKAKASDPQASCYDFSVVGEHCKALWATLYGFYQGMEYEWNDRCFGSFDTYFTSKRMCFVEPLKTTGGFCREGKSIPLEGKIP